MRPAPEAVALAKARPNYVQNVSEWGEWAAAMRPYYDQAEETTACAAIRILAAECDALEVERDQAQNAAEHAKAFKRVLKDTNSKLKAKCDALAKERDALLESCVLAVDELERCNVTADSYGVHGSEFRICNICDAESGAGVLDKGIPHDPYCLIAKLSAAIAAVKGGKQ